MKIKIVRACLEENKLSNQQNNMGMRLLVQENCFLNGLTKYSWRV